MPDDVAFALWTKEVGMRSLIVVLIVLIMGQAATVLPAAPLAEADAPLITAAELKAELGDPGITILDVRRWADWNTSDRKIVGAVREDPESVEAWAGKYAKEKTLVLYCA
jgi:rhodanese-related sulfurtransferase